MNSTATKEIEQRQAETEEILDELEEALVTEDVEKLKKAVEKNSQRENIWDFLARIKKQ